MSERANLNDQIQESLKAFIAGQSETDQKTIAHAFEKLLQSDAGANAPTDGEQAPDFELPNVRGGSTRLSTLLDKGPVVLNFYRGGWCPFCNLEFKALSDNLPQIKALGAELVGISPELPDKSLDTVEKFKLPFEVLSDVGNQIAKQYGLLMTVYEELRPLYTQWGIDLPASNGDESFQLPIPATFVIKQDGSIQACYVNKDYTWRMEPQAIIDALKQC